MKYIFVYILFLFILKSNSKLSEDKMKELFSKYVKILNILMIIFYYLHQILI